MTAIPAKVAGVPEVVLAVPADKQRIDPVLLAAAHYAGVDEFYLSLRSILVKKSID